MLLLGATPVPCVCPQVSSLSSSVPNHSVSCLFPAAHVQVCVLHDTESATAPDCWRPLCMRDVHDVLFLCPQQPRSAPVDSRLRPHLIAGLPLLLPPARLPSIIVSSREPPPLRMCPEWDSLCVVIFISSIAGLVCLGLAHTNLSCTFQVFPLCLWRPLQFMLQHLLCSRCIWVDP